MAFVPDNGVGGEADMAAMTPGLEPVTVPGMEEEPMIDPVAVEPLQDAEVEDPEPSASVQAAVSAWTSKIVLAKAYFEEDFCRMRKNMEFATGYQWEDQINIEDPRYVANMTLRAVNQKVAQLYARNPKVTAKRTRRMDFQMWDGRIESIQQSAALQMNPMAQPADQMAAAALMADYTQGRQQRDMIDKVGQTMEHLFSYELANHTPTFKASMKALVRRTVITGVGFVRVNFSRDINKVLGDTITESTMGERIGRVLQIGMGMKDGSISEDDAQVEEMKSLVASLNNDTDQVEMISERLIIDFPKVTSVIVDPKCTQLKDFVGADWIAIESMLTLDEVNAFFGKDIQASGGVKIYGGDRSGIMTTPEAAIAAGGSGASSGYPSPTLEQRCCVWEVFDRASRTCFFIVEGHNDYAKPPDAMYPKMKSLWPVFVLCFNGIEVEPGEQKASIYPPSDVSLLRPAQKEWNQTRNDLKMHRRANRPKYGVPKGILSDADKRKLGDCHPNEVIEFDSMQPGQKISELIAPLVHQPIDQTVYDNTPLQQDMFMVLGNEEGPVAASADNTATAATINEQSRLVTTASNVDDLDDLLSDLAEAGGEVLLREFSPENVRRIVGPGAVWPTTDIENFVNYVYLTVEGASSGRPNKALEIANFTQLAPLLLQAGASPAFIVREAIKRLDDRLDMDEAFPFGASMAVAPMGGPGMGGGTQQGDVVTGANNGEPHRGATGPTQNGQHPAGTVPRSRMENPVVG